MVMDTTKNYQVADHLVTHPNVDQSSPFLICPTCKSDRIVMRNVLVQGTDIVDINMYCLPTFHQFRLKAISLDGSVSVFLRNGSLVI